MAMWHYKYGYIFCGLIKPKLQICKLSKWNFKHISLDIRMVKHFNSWNRYNTFNSCNVVQRRSLFTDEALGMDEFHLMRKKTAKSFPEDLANSFIMQMQHRMDVAGGETALLMPEDLHTLACLCTGDQHTLNILQDAVVRSQQQQQQQQQQQEGLGASTGVADIADRTFKLGQLLARLYCHLDNPALALQALDSPSLAALFQDHTSQQVLLTLLYRHGHYETVLAAVEALSAKLAPKQPYPSSSLTLGLAAALQLRSKDSRRRGLAVATCARGRRPMPRRALVLTAVLALQQQRPDLALAALASNPWPGYYTVRNAMVQAWCGVGKLMQVLMLLRPLVDDDIPAPPTGRRPQILRDTVEAVEAAVGRSGDVGLVQEWRRVERALRHSGSIQDKVLEDCVLAPINPPTPRRSDALASYEAAAFMRGSHNRFQNPIHEVPRRPGLMDMPDV